MPDRLELYQEYLRPEEEAAARELIAHEQALLEATYARGAFKRDFHAKTHAAVRAELVVGPDIEERFRVGVFAEPRTWKAFIRFSSSSEHDERDSKRDARGLAVKLLGVPGEKLLPAESDAETHDFIFFTPPRFFTRDTRGFVDFINVLHSGSRLRIAAFIAGHPRMTYIVRRSFKRHANLLEESYFSATPYRLGELAVKYILQPHQPRRSEVPKPAPRNFLRQRLRDDLARGEARFDFCVQVQADPHKTPIEDPSVTWPEALAPYHKVAELVIPPQSFDAPAQMRFAEDLSLNPWHAIEAHRPLGNVNHARRLVYEAIARFRRARNGVAHAEPTLADWDRFATLGT